MSPFSALYRLVLRRLLTRSRAIGLGAVGLVLIGVGVLVARDPTNPVRTTVEVTALLSLLLVVPLVCLVIATPAIGEWLDDETLVYVWLRPVSRRTLAVAPWLAALTVAVPMNVFSTALFAAIGSGLDSRAMLGAVVSSLVATLAYCSVFVCIGAWSKRALVIGFGYVFVWEGVIAQFGPGLARLSIRSYAVSSLATISKTSIELDGRANISIVVMLVVVVAGALALTTRILQRKDVP